MQKHRRVLWSIRQSMTTAFSLFGNSLMSNAVTVQYHGGKTGDIQQQTQLQFHYLFLLINGNIRKCINTDIIQTTTLF